jgi:hypothetical protein
MQLYAFEGMNWSGTGMRGSNMQDLPKPGGSFPRKWETRMLDVD